MTLVLIVFLIWHYYQTTAPFNKELLRTFDLGDESSNDFSVNGICSLDQTNNACNPFDQLRIYQNWHLGKKNQMIKKHHRMLIENMDKIFDFFKQYETFAVQILGLKAEPGIQTNCQAIAGQIDQLKISLIRDNLIKKMKEAYQFFYTSKKGFQCTICNSDNHKYFNADNKSITLNLGFCYEMVNKTFSYFNFEFLSFMKIARLFSLFSLRCDFQGKYQHKPIPDYVQFVVDPKSSKAILECKGAQKTKASGFYCQSYCKMNSPISFSGYLETNKEKFFLYKKFLQDNLKNFIKKLNVFSIETVKTQANARILAATDQVLQTETETEIINQFNKDFKTKMIIPITYNNEEDLVLAQFASGESVIYEPDPRYAFQLDQFQIEFRAQGINFYNEGQKTQINKTNAIVAFNLLAPDMQRLVNPRIIKELNITKT